MPDNNNFSRTYHRIARNAPVTPEPPSDSKGHLKMSKGKTKWLRRMTLEVNKFPYSNTKTIGLYSFNRSEMEWYYKEIRLLADKVLDILECPFCEDTIKQAVLPRCGCDNPMACCTKCWVEGGPSCFTCKRHCTSIPFEPADEIIKECHLFLKEKAFHKDMKCKGNELKRIFESYYQFLKQAEMQLMCDYCFGTLEKTRILNFEGLDSNSQVCSGCHELYMECYKKCREVAPYPTFDRLNHEFTQFFARVLAYCTQNMKQVYTDPYPGMKQPSFFRVKVLKRQSFKGKILGIFKSAVVVAACAYLVVYCVQ